MFTALCSPTGSRHRQHPPARCRGNREHQGGQRRHQRGVCPHPPGPGPALVFALSSRWGRTGATWGLGCSPQGLTPSPGLRVPLGKPRALCLGPPQLTVSGPCLLSMVPWFGLTWDRPGPPPPWCCWGRQPGQAALTQAQRGAALGCRFPGSICGTAEERSPGREVPPVCLLAGFTPPLVWLGHQAACSGCGGDGARSSSPAGGVRAVGGGPRGPRPPARGPHMPVPLSPRPSRTTRASGCGCSSSW